MNDLASFLWPLLIILSRNRFRRSKERGRLARGDGSTISSHWNPNDLTKKTSSKLDKDVVNQKLYHSAYLTCSVQTISTRIDGVYKIPLSTCNFSMSISATSISPLERIVLRMTQKGKNLIDHKTKAFCLIFTIFCFE